MFAVRTPRARGRSKNADKASAVLRKAGMQCCPELEVSLLLKDK